MSLNLPHVTTNLEDISPLVIGGAIFNTQYNDDPFSMPIKDLLLHGFENGINAIDTSPYYGPSEELLGQCLNSLINDDKLITRENFYICTKVGRLQLDDFDYSASWVKKSIARSLERLHTKYLDVVYLHDIEFVEEEGIMEALRTLMQLKKDGYIRNVGISGYPVEFLYKIASLCVDQPDIGCLDLVLSYSNMCLQNIKLGDWYDRFMTNTHIKLLNNASILSMSLLRSQETKSFHPCSQELKNTVSSLSKVLLAEHNVELAELATRFAIREWKSKKGKTVLGVSTKSELESALVQYRLVLSGEMDELDAKLYELSKSILGEHFNETWASGIAGR
ncbi:hypothetical protein CANARDRAFT_9360 [[Candida] arabinofermentans NRRL YB-2248]|uniref:NADP-dependent oxidoreductase domain-containing protein n=1 Tax=[Candida] arabinofermentans NRRL YB-2248 TaxID=983967 RepID=A0A1E4SWD6_9ASCO|nr:hypothetical protein CANARDRAFT_9360 [[Candida] arabinofermentans NRRL YB-2248]